MLMSNHAAHTKDHWRNWEASLPAVPVKETHSQSERSEVVALQEEASSMRKTIPPTQAALKEAIMRAHYQTMVWNNAKLQIQSLRHLRNMDGQWKKVIFHVRN